MTPGPSRSLWMTEALRPGPPLEADARADVCVVGAGIAGLSAAYLLGRAGKAVVVLDAGATGGGQTQRTTAHLSNAIDDRYLAIERLHGERGARLAAESHTAAIDHIERVVAREGIDCGFRRLDGYLFLHPGGDPDLLDREREAARRAGLEVQALAGGPPGSFDTGPCLRFPGQAQFHPLRYLAGLVRGILRDGGRIHGDAPVVSVAGGDPARVATRQGPVVTADAVVVATNTPINDRVQIHLKQTACQTYAIGARVARGAVAPALYWDTQDPYHYLRLQDDPEGDGEILIVGGEDHRTGQAGDGIDRHARLEAWTRARFPHLGPVAYRWSGQVQETLDGLAYIGRNPLDPPNVYIATGDSGMGMTHGTIAGILLTQLILGHPDDWAELYDPGRTTLRSLPRFAQDAGAMAWQYTDWLTPGDAPGPAAVAPGTGAVMRRGLTKVAVYREPDGTLHELSAVCPHLGGIVRWNPVESTWDCPCHGSRFDARGRVVCGPAIGDLERLDGGPG